MVSIWCRSRHQMRIKLQHGRVMSMTPRPPLNKKSTAWLIWNRVVQVFPLSRRRLGIVCNLHNQSLQSILDIFTRALNIDSFLAAVFQCVCRYLYVSTTSLTVTIDPRAALSDYHPAIFVLE